MSKAEQRAKERYWLEPSNIDTQNKYQAYLEGYQQAQKDLALTIEDIEKIDNLLWDLSSKWSGKSDNKGYFKDVLNRFNEQKEK